MDSTELPPAQPASNYTRPDDASQYIRTYAKDVAELTNTPLPASAPHAKPSLTSQPLVVPGGTDTPTTIEEEGVTMTDFDSSPVNRSGDAASPKEFQQEVAELTQEDSSGIFSSGQPEPVPSLIPQPAADPERDAVLARLRAKVEASRATEPAPEPESPLRTAAPTFSSMSVSDMPSPRSTFELPNLGATQQPVSGDSTSTSGLHTYSGDFANRIDDQSSSRFAVLAAQSDASPVTQKQAPPPKRNLVPLFVGSAMLVVGIGAVIGAYLFLHNVPGVPTISTVPSLITYDETVPLEGSGTELQQALSNASQGTAVQGNVVVTYVTGQDASSTNAIAQPGGVLIHRLSLPAPDILLRNIDDSSTVGYLRAGTESRPFFLLRVNSYERTFAGMLAWERTLPQDLSILYPAYTSQQAPSTSSSLVVLPNSGPTFVDAVVANHDVRILRDSSGRSLVLYGYITKDTLIIARDEAAFTALAGRLSNVDK